MSDPLFGPLEVGDAAALFGEPGTFTSSDDRGSDALGLDPEMACGLFPWHAGAFALLLQDLPPGAVEIHGPSDAYRVLVQTRLLRPGGHLTLLVVEGPAPHRSHGDLLLTLAGDGETARFPLRTAPAPLDRPLATLIGQALARSGSDSEERRNWQPLTRHLSTICELAVRADLSLPVGPGLVLVLDGDLGLVDAEPLAMALDGANLRALKARAAVDPQTGRSVVLLPALAARCFVLLDDGLVDITCPPGATRSEIGRAPGAGGLRPSEGETLLDLLRALALDVGPRVPDWLPVPHALGWRGADGGSLAVVGAVPVDAGTVLFLAADNRDHELANLVVRDVTNEAASLFDVAEPIAAFHPDPERHADRLHLVVLLPRRLPAGALHVALRGTSDGGGWLRTMDAAAPQTRTILKAWLPPAPADEAYLRIVAASVRTSAARGTTVVAAEDVPEVVRRAPVVTLVIATNAEAGAAERTAEALPAALRRSIPIVFVLGLSDPGHEGTMHRLASLARMDNLEIGVIVLAGPAGAGPAITTAFERLAADRALVVEAGALFSGTDAAVAVALRPQANSRDGVVLGEDASPPLAALLTRGAVDGWTRTADRRLAGVPAVLDDLVAATESRRGPVHRLAGFAFEPDPARTGSFESLVDRALLASPRPPAAYRGTA
jgi:hypothetical protein